MMLWIGPTTLMILLSATSTLHMTFGNLNSCSDSYNPFPFSHPAQHEHRSYSGAPCVKIFYDPISQLLQLLTVILISVFLQVLLPRWMTQEPLNSFNNLYSYLTAGWRKVFRAQRVSPRTTLHVSAQRSASRHTPALQCILLKRTVT